MLDAPRAFRTVSWVVTLFSFGACTSISGSAGRRHYGSLSHHHARRGAAGSVRSLAQGPSDLRPDYGRNILPPAFSTRSLALRTGRLVMSTESKRA